MADGPDLTDIVRRAAQVNAKFYKGWMDLSLEYLRGLSGVIAGTTSLNTPVQEMDAGMGALVLEGEAGTPVRGSFLVSNDLDRPVSCKFVAADFKDPNGVSVRAKVAFDPPGLELKPGEQRTVQVAIDIDESLMPGVGYAGEISIGGMEGFAVPVVLRRQHRVDETQPESKPTETAKSAPTAKRAAKTTKPRGRAPSAK